MEKEFFLNYESISCWQAETMWTDPGLKSGIGVRELISF